MSCWESMREQVRLRSRSRLCEEEHIRSDDHATKKNKRPFYLVRCGASNISYCTMLFNAMQWEPMMIMMMTMINNKDNMIMQRLKNNRASRSSHTPRSRRKRGNYYHCSFSRRRPTHLLGKKSCPAHERPRLAEICKHELPVYGISRPFLLLRHLQVDPRR